MTWAWAGAHQTQLRFLGDRQKSTKALRETEAVNPQITQIFADLFNRRRVPPLNL
jgi:hypothetical protein